MISKVMSEMIKVDNDILSQLIERIVLDDDDKILTDGIKKIDVDLKKKVGTVVYNASIIDINAIENTIASLGYDANDTPADAKVYEKLDLCCKVPGK